MAGEPAAGCPAAAQRLERIADSRRSDCELPASLVVNHHASRGAAVYDLRELMPNGRRTLAHRNRQRALVAGDVFRQLHRRWPGARTIDHLDRRARRGHRSLRQLPGRYRIAQRMRALAVETDAAAAHVQPRAHAMATLRRRHHVDSAVDRDPSDPLERVAHDLTLERELTWIRDVRIHAAAAAGIRKWV